MATLQKWQQFLASAPEAQREYRTVELWHPQFETVYRFVSDTYPLDLKLEHDAPRNNGQVVTFGAATLSVQEPAERQDSSQALTVEFGNVDGTIHRIIDQISGSGFFTPMQVVYRKYYSADLSRPAVPPLYLFAASVGFDGPTSVSFSAEDSDLSQKRSGTIYTVEQYPGLRE